MSGIPVAGDVRGPRVAGLFYSEAGDALRKEIAGYFREVDLIPDIEQIYGLIVPHAGYKYSGRVAAKAYAQLEDRTYDTVFVVAPSHRESFEGISVFTGKSYKTPLGEIDIDRESAEELIQTDPHIQASWSGHRDEHALEVQLPFLQLALKEFRLVPLVMGEQNRENCEALAGALSKIIKNKNALLIASSDLSHFYSYDDAVSLDEIIVENVGKFDTAALWESTRNKKCEACGMGPMISVLNASKRTGAQKTKVLSYKNSGDITGDTSRVVGYMSAMIY